MQLMAGRQSAAVQSAMRAYRPGRSVYKLAKRFGIDASSLYRAIKAKGKRRGRSIVET